MYTPLPSAPTALERLVARPTLPVSAKVAVYFADLLAHWAERSASRRTLQHLPDEVLEDVGLTRAQAADEAAKPFWRA